MTDTHIANGQAVTEEPPEDPRRSADPEPQRAFRPEGTPGFVQVVLRKIIGIREEVLAWAPEEYPRYTRLGAIVLNTAAIAVLSMEIALGKVIDARWWVLLPIALFWGFLIVSLDGWMVASSHGILSTAKIRVFIPRLAMSIVIGVVIAEPVLMWVFQPSIRSEIAAERQDDVRDLTTDLTRCNPVPPVPVDRTACAGHVLNIVGSPQSLQKKLDDLKTQRDTVAATFAGLQSQLNEKETFAEQECAGKAGTGLSGQAGVGDRCRYDRVAVDKFRQSSGIDSVEQQLESLNAQVADTTRDLGNAEATYASTVTTEIAKQVKALKDAQGTPGLLDEDRALGRLAAKNLFVASGEWLLRVLLILIDCLPVLAKLLGGTTTYDRLLARQLDATSRLHDRYVSVREEEDNATSDVRSRRADQDRAARLEEINDKRRASRARYEQVLNVEIDELAEQLRGTQRFDTDDETRGSG